jgi:hypothetical protein
MLTDAKKKPGVGMAAMSKHKRKVLAQEPKESLSHIDAAPQVRDPVKQYVAAKPEKRTESNRPPPDAAAMRPNISSPPSTWVTRC